MYSDSPRSVYQKIILCLFAAMAVIFAIWTAVSRTNEGVLFREEMLDVSHQGSAIVYSGELYGTAVTITCREENGVDPWFNFEFDMADIIRFANGPGTSAYGSWLFYFITLFSSIFGALLTAFPYATFYFNHFLHVRNPEPTDLYLLCHKIGSIAYAVFILFAYIKGISTIV